MPDIETDELNQTAVYWEKLGQDDSNEPLIADPIELNVRWEVKDRESIDANGNPILLNAFAAVEQEILIGSLLWLGILEDWLDVEEGELMYAAVYNETPDIRNRVIRRTVGMIKFGRTLPESGEA